MQLAVSVPSLQDTVETDLFRFSDSPKVTVVPSFRADADTCVCV